MVETQRTDGKIVRPKFIIEKAEMNLSQDSKEHTLNNLVEMEDYTKKRRQSTVPIVNINDESACSDAQSAPNFSKGKSSNP